MNSYRKIFHLISYLQYLFYVAGLIYLTISVLDILGIVNDLPDGLEPRDLLEAGYPSWNLALFMFGLGVSFSTLQDLTKTQNSLSRKVWQDPNRGRQFLFVMMATAILFVIAGLLGLLAYPETIFGGLSYGFLAFGIAYICVVRSAMEMFENHRSDRASSVNRLDENS